MRCLIVFACILLSCTTAQNERGRRPYDNRHGWNIRLAVPGEPGRDYPTLHSIPRTTFTCSGKAPGYYADIETNCQVFRVCTLGSTYGFQSFLCPNGTLFNQAVMVCDWWMKVNCEKSRELFENNNNKFAKLKWGPQFMNDIKNMITHPMRNPYDKTIIKSNYIVMQEYKPPPGQLYRSAQVTFSDQNLNDIYSSKIPSFQKSSFPDIYSNNDISFAASTPSTQYIPNFDVFNAPFYRNTNTFQKQIQSKPNLQYNSIESKRNTQSIINANGQSEKIAQAKSKDYLNSNKNIQSVKPTQLNQNIRQNVQFNKNNFVKHNTELINEQRNQYTNNIQNRNVPQYGNQYPKQYLNQELVQNKPLNSHKPNQARYSNDVGNRIGIETKQNLVSTDKPSKLIKKTVTFKRIIKDAKEGAPKSRITFKTWIVRPSRNSKLIAEPTPYTYNAPTDFQNIKSGITTTDNFQSKLLQINSNAGSYQYYPPTVSSNQKITTIQDASIETVPPTQSYPEISTFLTSQPTLTTPFYIAPTTFKPSPIFYIPSNYENQKQISQQYLSPNIISEQLVAAGSSPTPFIEQPLKSNENNPSFSVVKRSQINTNRNNLTFSDILTKEKLDITVNDIVKHTNHILQTASPIQISQFREDADQSTDYPVDNYLPANLDYQSDEKLTLQPPPTLPKSARLRISPSNDLEPPFESFLNNQNSNRISNLPFFMEPANTIERTVSLKITIPEKVADYLFKNSNKNNLSNLEILNSDTSNYLVLSNEKAKTTSPTFIPIGKLIWNNNNNVSNSQDLVLSFLADSINAVKEYGNIAQENILSPTPTQPQFQNLNPEELGRITNDVSQLTSSQFLGTNSTIQKYANLVASSQSTMNPPYKIKETNTPATKQDNPPAKKQIPPNENNILFIRNKQQEIQKQNAQTSNVRTTSNDTQTFQKLQFNSDKIYSGQLYQLPVPEVTKQIYNSPTPSTSNIVNQNAKLQSSFNKYSNGLVRNYNDIKRSNSDIEIVKSHTIPPSTYADKKGHQEFTEDQGFSSNAFIDNIQLSKNGLTAQVRDKIEGTIPHPLNEKKFVTYKNDKLYYIRTRNNINSENNQEKLFEEITDTDQLYTPIRQNGNKNSHLALQLIPSVGYKLENENDQQKILNAFQIDEFGYPKTVLYPNGNNISNRRQDLSTDVDYTIEHPTRTSNTEDYSSNSNVLYDGPSSYLAPQASVGTLEVNQNIRSNSNYNSNIEKFDTNVNVNGYPRITPSKRFLF